MGRPLELRPKEATSTPNPGGEEIRALLEDDWVVPVVRLEEGRSSDRHPLEAGIPLELRPRKASSGSKSGIVEAYRPFEHALPRLRVEVGGRVYLGFVEIGLSPEPRVPKLRDATKMSIVEVGVTLEDRTPEQDVLGDVHPATLGGVAKRCPRRIQDQRHLQVVEDDAAAQRGLGRGNIAQYLGGAEVRAPLEPRSVDP